MDKLQKNSEFTDIQKKIINLTLDGKTNREIAEEIFVSVTAVKYHLKIIYEKTGVESKKELLIYYLKNSGK